MARSGGLSPILMGMMLQSVFGQSSNTIGHMPDDAWFALSSTPVDTNGSLTEPPVYINVDEYGDRVPSGGTLMETGYQRVRAPLHDQDAWTESGVSAVVNAVEIRFPEAQRDWGRIKFWAMLDEDTRGRVLAFGALRRTVTVFTGDQPVFAPGSIHIALDSYTREW